jgi:hypothetical protein
MSNLSIFIPTFDRPQLLALQLDRFIPQLDTVDLVVIDNASNSEVQRQIPPRVRYFRNSLNIGGTGNVLRCFELCESEWIWICSDDDPILDDAVLKAQELTKQFSDTCFISTSSTLTTHINDRRVMNIPDMIHSFPSIDRLFWITGGIYNARILRQFMRVAHILPCVAPQTVLLLMALSQGIPAGLSKTVISGHNYPPDANERWNLYEVLSYLSDLTSLPIDIESRKAISSSLENCILSFDAHFLQVCKTVAEGVQGADELTLLFGYRWSKIFITLESDEKNNELNARLNLLRDQERCKQFINNLAPQISQSLSPIEACPRFQRL